jgi:hypothetical protein
MIDNKKFLLLSKNDCLEGDYTIEYIKIYKNIIIEKLKRGDKHE